MSSTFFILERTFASLDFKAKQSSDIRTTEFSKKYLINRLIALLGTDSGIKQGHQIPY